MRVVDAIYWLTTGIMWASIIYGYLTRKKISKMWLKNYEDFVVETQGKYDEFVTFYNERATLLSKENTKLLSQNEELKERLRSLGIKDFDVI